MARTTAAQKAAAVATVAEALGVDPEALAALVAQKPSATAKAKVEAKVEAKPAVKPFNEQLDEGIAAAGYSFARGRNYISKALVEAQARALGKKTAGYEIVKSAAEGVHNVAVVVVRDEQGRVYSQNLARSA